MNLSLIGRECIVLIIAIVFWLVSFSEHAKVSPGNSDAIRLPRHLGILFGSSRTDGVLNVRGVGIQVFWYVMTPIYTLYIFNVIPLRAVAYALIIPGVLITMLFLCAYIQSKKR